MHKTEPF